MTRKKILAQSRIERKITSEYRRIMSSSFYVNDLFRLNLKLDWWISHHLKNDADVKKRRRKSGKMPPRFRNLPPAIYRKKKDLGLFWDAFGRENDTIYVIAPGKVRFDLHLHSNIYLPLSGSSFASSFSQKSFVKNQTISTLLSCST